MRKIIEVEQVKEAIDPRRNPFDYRQNIVDRLRELSNHVDNKFTFSETRFFYDVDEKYVANAVKTLTTIEKAVGDIEDIVNRLAGTF